jgi:ABC-type multidrug transport system fused ATPase/permease subunit
VFKPGETTAIVGPSGSGKSTIMQLIERFYNTSGGQILFDGEDINSIDITSLRQCMGYVG